jgi:hypothetical protein
MAYMFSGAALLRLRGVFGASISLKERCPQPNSACFWIFKFERCINRTRGECSSVPGSNGTPTPRPRYRPEGVKRAS